ncbi:MAG: FeoA family protein [Planctomycetota bacterium]
MLTDLERLSPGATAEVVGISGGLGMRAKLEAMGLREGKQVRKLGAQFMRGPVTVVVDGRQMAMGRGIARRIEVELRD